MLRVWLVAVVLQLGCAAKAPVKGVDAVQGIPDRIAFGSCARSIKPQPILNTIVDAEPDLFVYLGDNIYGDTRLAFLMRAKYEQLAIKKPFKRLRANIPVVSIWDDHDYGGNDDGASSTYAHRLHQGLQDIPGWDAMIMGSGIELTSASVLTGTSTPSPPEVPVVDFDGLSYHSETGAETIEWGDEIVASWDEHGWEQVWVQVRREREGEAWESVTCDASGDTSFTMTSDVWDLMDEDLEVESNNIYVAFTMSREDTSEDGLKVEAVTRAMAVGVVQD